MSTHEAPTRPFTSYSNLDEHQWVINIRRCLTQDLGEETQSPAVCIFGVPKALMSTSPESYIPHLVALGPYHYWRPQLHEIERYKLVCAKRTQKRLQCLNFHTLVDRLMKFEPWIRGCYGKYLDFSGETLGWMMAVDASFLLDFLQTCAPSDGSIVTLSRSVVSSRMSLLMTRNLILRDIVMLENPIPLFIFRNLLQLQYSSLDSVDGALVSMLRGLCQELSPFKTIYNSLKVDISKCVHFLDFIYNTMVPKVDEPCDINNEDDNNQAPQDEESESVDPGYVKQLVVQLWNMVSKLTRGPLLLIKAPILSTPLKIVLNFTWKILSDLPGFSNLKQLMEYLFFSQDKENEKPGNDSGPNSLPLAEEIAIPSVADLCKSGIRFKPTNGNISTITFDVKTVTLHLPTISLVTHTEVVLRNLVAYEEASKTSGPLVLTRYTELMNGIIDTEEDVKILRKRGIILNHLKNDQEAADLWNGMSRSIRLTKVPFMDKVIKDVNRYHSCGWNVKARNLFKKYVHGSWQFLTLLAAILLLTLMALQTFCSVSTCSQILHIDTSSLNP